MKLTDDTVTDYYLKPAEMLFCTEPSRVRTVLGSCVSVVMFHAASRFGAICHAMQAECGVINCREKECPERFKYVDCSVRMMLRLFEQRGAKRRQVVVKLFGGADMFGSGSGSAVGRRNIIAAVSAAEACGLLISACNVGGTRGRKLLFYSHTGEVFMKYQHRAAEGIRPQKKAVPGRGVLNRILRFSTVQQEPCPCF